MKTEKKGKVKAGLRKGHDEKNGKEKDLTFLLLYYTISS